MSMGAISNTSGVQEQWTETGAQKLPQSERTSHLAGALRVELQKLKSIIFPMIHKLSPTGFGFHFVVFSGMWMVSTNQVETHE